MNKLRLRKLLTVVGILVISTKIFALTVINETKEISAARAIIKEMKLTAQFVAGQPVESFKLIKGEFEKKLETGIVRAEIGADADSPILLIYDENKKVKSVFFVLWTSGGGSGRWAEVKQVQLDPGEPKEIKTFPRIKEDRPNIKEIKLTGNELVLNVLLHGKNDPSCCASSPSTIKYSLLSP